MIKIKIMALLLTLSLSACAGLVPVLLSITEETLAEFCEFEANKHHAHCL